MKFIFKIEKAPYQLTSSKPIFVGNVYYDDNQKKVVINLIMGMGSKIRMMFYRLGHIIHFDRLSDEIHFTLSKDKPENELGNMVVKSYFIKDHLGVPLYTNPTDPDDVFEFCKDGLIEVFGEVPREIYMTIGKIDEIDKK